MAAPVVMQLLFDRKEGLVMGIFDEIAYPLMVDPGIAAVPSAIWFAEYSGSQIGAIRLD